MPGGEGNDGPQRPDRGTAPSRRGDPRRAAPPQFVRPFFTGGDEDRGRTPGDPTPPAPPPPGHHRTKGHAAAPYRGAEPATQAHSRPPPRNGRTPGERSLGGFGGPPPFQNSRAVISAATTAGGAAHEGGNNSAATPPPGGGPSPPRPGPGNSDYSRAGEGSPPNTVAGRPPHGGR